MSRLQKYAELHRYATRLAEDDLTEDQDEAATVAYSVGQIAQAVGTTIQGVALRIHKTEDPAAKEMFYAGLSEVSEQLNAICENVGVMAAPFSGLREEADSELSPQLRDSVAMFSDDAHSKVLFQAQEFIAEHLKEGRISE